MLETDGRMEEVETLWRYFSAQSHTSMERCDAYRAFLDIVDKAYGIEGIRYIRRLRERDGI